MKGEDDADVKAMSTLVLHVMLPIAIVAFIIVVLVFYLNSKGIQVKAPIFW